MCVCGGWVGGGVMNRSYGYIHTHAATQRGGNSGQRGVWLIN